MARLTEPLGGYARPGAGPYGQLLGPPNVAGGPGVLPPIGGGGNSDQLGVLGAPRPPGGRITPWPSQFGPPPSLTPTMPQINPSPGGLPRPSDVGGFSTPGPTPTPSPAPAGGYYGDRKNLGGTARMTGRGELGDPPPFVGSSLQGNTFRQWGGAQPGGFVNPLSRYYGGGVGSTLPPPGGNVPGGGTLPPISDSPLGTGNRIMPGSPESSGGGRYAGTPGNKETGEMKGVYVGPPGVLGYDPLDPSARYRMGQDTRPGREGASMLGQGAAYRLANMMAQGWRSPGSPDVNYTWADAERDRSKALQDLAAAYADGSMDFEQKQWYETYMATQAWEARNPGGGITNLNDPKPQNPIEAYFDRYRYGPFEEDPSMLPNAKGEYDFTDAGMRPGYRDDPFFKAWAAATPGGLEPPPYMAGGLTPSQAQVDEGAKAFRDWMRRTTGMNPDPVDDQGNPWPDTTPEEYAQWQAYCGQCRAKGVQPTEAGFQQAQQSGQV